MTPFVQKVRLLPVLLSALVSAACQAQANPPRVSHLRTTEQGVLSPSRLCRTSSGEVLVTDPEKGEILRYTAVGTLVSSHTIGGNPLGIAADERGQVYVADPANHTVRVFAEDWSERASIGSATYPNDLALDQASGRLYLTDSEAALVHVYSTQGSFLFTFGGKGSDPGRLDFPTAICLDTRHGEILVADHNNHRIQIFDLDGNYKSAFGEEGGGWGKFTRLLGIDVDRTGRIYVVDAFQGQVQVVTRDGEWLTSVGQFGSEKGKLTTPTDVLVQENGWMWVTSSNTSRIEIFGIKDLMEVTEGAIWRLF